MLCRRFLGKLLSLYFRLATDPSYISFRAIGSDSWVAKAARTDKPPRAPRSSLGPLNVFLNRQSPALDPLPATQRGYLYPVPANLRFHPPPRSLSQHAQPKMAPS